MPTSGRGSLSLRVIGLACLTALSVLPRTAGAQRLPVFDFTDAAAVAEWAPTHDVRELAHTPEGMRIVIGGDDPYLFGPARDYPVDQPLWLHIRLRSETGGVGQVFYFRTQPSEENSVRFAAAPGQWQDAKLPLPPLGAGWRLRLDPPGTSGVAVVALIELLPRTLLAEPAWPAPVASHVGPDSPALVSGEVRLSQAQDRLSDFTITVDGAPMAVGYDRPLIGYRIGGNVRWLDIAEVATTRAVQARDGIAVAADLRDQDGGSWRLTQRFAPGKPNAIDVDTTVSCDRDRDLVYFSPLTLLPGCGSFGGHKDSALLAGLEYLDRDEPSSSDADIRGPAANRRVPDSRKITFPLMAIVSDGRYVGLTWHPDPALCALFDSPDRTFGGGGHVIGLLMPGSDGSNRQEGSLLPYDGMPLRADRPYSVRATIIGATGADVTAPVKQAVSLLRLPRPPHDGVSAASYDQLAATGWLDSGCRDGDLFHHALPGSFPGQPAADAAVMMLWLAARRPSSEVQAGLRQAAASALSDVPPDLLDVAGVGHVRYPVASLLFGHVPETSAHSLDDGTALLARFQADGTVRYEPQPGKPNLGSTHFAPTANGLTAQLVADVLEDAALTADPTLLREAHRLLHALDRYDGTAPRGAQTWEVPLHTPDVLASAFLVRAYTLGYELYGEPALLERAKYWAWTGVPFVYLVPTAGPIGLYSSIAVYGATFWVAPVWFGMPVQWCGLVYADSLYRLASQDPTGPWSRIADGLTVSGIDQTWPVGSDPKRQGLLPDSFNLGGQVRNDPAINPATVQAAAAQYFREPIYGFAAFRQGHVFVHAPGRIERPGDDTDAIRFTVRGWSPDPYRVLIVGLHAVPTIKIDGRPHALGSDESYDSASGRLILLLRGTPTVELTIS